MEYGEKREGGYRKMGEEARGIYETMIRYQSRIAVYNI